MAHESSCARCGTTPPPDARFCHGCGAPMGASEEGERRTVTVVFADLSGFTSYSEQVDPERVRAVADDAAACLREIVERHGGTVDKVIGDCVMGVFGAPVTHEDDPTRAVRAALEMRDAVGADSRRFEGMPLSIGVNTGEAMFATVGGAMTVIGDTVNTAARLQSAAARGQILIGAATAEGCEAEIELEAVAPIEAKGKEELVPAWRAVRSRDRRHRLAAVARTPLVGRDDELVRLIELWQRANADHRAQAVCLLGEPGVGKTRLVSELASRVDGRVVVGRCLPYGDGITYWPLVEVVNDLASIDGADDAAAVADKLDRFLVDLGVEDADEMRSVAGAVAVLLGAATTPRGTYVVDRVGREELHWGLCRLLELVAAQRPLLLVVEDLHWADPALHDFLGELPERTSHPLLLVTTTRPGTDAAVRRRSTRGRVLEVPVLSDDDAGRLFAIVAGAESQDRTELVVSLGGNPLFITEMARAVASGDAEDGLPLPSTVQGVIEARIDSLDPEAREVLGYAALAGPNVALDALAVLTESGDHLGVVVNRLADGGFARYEGSEVVIPHSLVRDAAVGRLTKRRRVQLHHRYANWLSLQPRDHDVTEVVAFHLEQACLLARDVASEDSAPLLEAANALQRAARRAETWSGLREAVRYYERALDVVGTRLPETAAGIRFRHAQARAVSGAVAEAAEELDLVATRAEALDRPLLRSAALVELAKLERVLGQVDAAVAHAWDAVVLADECGDGPLIAKARLATALLHASRGDLDAAIDQLAEGADLAASLGDERIEAQASLQLGALLLNQGRLREAEAALERCTAAAAHDTSVHQQAQATAFLAVIKRYRGPRDDAARLASQAAEWLDRVADHYVEVQARTTLTALARVEGDLESAERLAREAVEVGRDLPGWLPCALRRDLAVVLAERGDVDGAASLVTEIADGAASGGPSERAALALAEAAVAAARHEVDLAVALYNDAVTALESIGLALDAADARLELGEMLALAGRPDDARLALTAAFEAFTEMEADQAAADAKHALTQL